MSFISHYIHWSIDLLYLSILWAIMFPIQISLITGRGRTYVNFDVHGLHSRQLLFVYMKNTF